MSEIYALFKSKFNPELKIIISLTLVRLILHIAFINNYGIFRDELYYIACGEHLDFGYVDHPPFVALVAKLSTGLFGSSLFALRILSAIASCSLVFFAGLSAREFGGNKWAVALACLLVLLAPVLISTGIFLSMNSFDHMFWMICIYLLIKIIRTGNSRLWIWFGICVGIGFENKISILFLTLGIFAGLLISPQRKMFFDKYLWIGALCALVLALPNILWQIFNGWPTLEFIHNATLYKNALPSPLMFMLGIAMNINPLYFLLVFPALWFFFFDKNGKQFSLFGWMFIVLLLFFIVTRSKTYYMAPAFPVMLTAGAVMLGRMSKTTIIVMFFVITFIGLGSLPFALPVLPVDQFITYSRVLGITPKNEERAELAELPQLYADMFGWKEMTQTVAKVYYSLTPEERKSCAVFAQNYGEAAAVDYFGKYYGLPHAYCGHNSYWFWGKKNVTDKNILIVIGGDPKDHGKVYSEVKQAAVFSHRYAIPYENHLPIYICRGLKVPLKKVWPDTKFYI